MGKKNVFQAYGNHLLGVHNVISRKKSLLWVLMILGGILFFGRQSAMGWRICQQDDYPPLGYNCFGVIGTDTSAMDSTEVFTGSDITVVIGETCPDYYLFVIWWMGDPYNPTYPTISEQPAFPNYIDSGLNQDWGKQGPTVAVITKDCSNSVIPARGTFTGGAGDQMVHELDYEDEWPEEAMLACLNARANCVRGCTYYFKVEFNDKVFMVVGDPDQKSPLFFGLEMGGYNLGVTLRDTSCETLRLAKTEKVRVYAKKYQSLFLSQEALTFAPHCDVTPGYPNKAELGDVELVAEIGVTFIGQNPCPDPTEAGDDGEGKGGCSGGGKCGGGDDDECTVSPVEVRFLPETCLSEDEDLTRRTYGSVNTWGESEVNLLGRWYRAGYRYGWYVSTPTYELDTSTYHYTKLYFTMTDPITKTYTYSITGDWTSTEEARESAIGKIPLQSVVGNGQTQLFTYDGNGNLLTQQSATNDAYIIYSYDGGGRINRIWAGEDPCYYRSPPETPIVGYGRWVDAEYDSETGMLEQVSNGCSSCGSPERYYTYELSGSKYNVTTVKDATENILVSYRYDSQGRLTSHWLGDYNTDLHVGEWIYTDGDVNDPTSTNILVRRDYVDNTQYRAQSYISDRNGSMLEERAYHDLQSGGELTGAYSRTQYIYEKDASGEVTKVITRLPRGNEMHAVYDLTKGVVTEHLKCENGGAPVSLNKYSYSKLYQGSGAFKLVLNQSIDVPRNATTAYYYGGGNNDGPLVMRVDPAITGTAATLYGHTGNYSSEYFYDSQQRMTMEWSRDSTGTKNVSTQYVYDPYGNMTEQISGVLYNGGTSDYTYALTSRYVYNIYNELICSYDYNNSITTNLRKQFYDDSGTRIAEGVYLDNDNVISAVHYEYDADGRLTAKYEADENGAFTKDNLEIPANYYLVNWITTAYMYDDYGRRTAVVADVGGENLTTTYEYNNQSEVTRTIQPDNRYERTERDGRGLVIRSITGYITTGTTAYDVDVATTEMFYDANGNLTKKKDPEGICEYYKYDGFDRLRSTHRGRE